MLQLWENNFIESIPQSLGKNGRKGEGERVGRCGGGGQQRWWHNVVGGGGAVVVVAIGEGEEGDDVVLKCQ